MRLGRIPWINAYPVYGAIDRGLVTVPASLVSGTASELNDLLAAGELDVSVVSAVEYARNAARSEVRRVHERLLESRSWGLAHLDELSAEAAGATAVSEQVCRAYLAGLDYALSYRHLAGLTDFFRRLAQDGLVPDGSLSFISAA